MGEDTEGPAGNFTLSTKHQVFFTPTRTDEEEQKLTNVSVASTIPISTWMNGTEDLCSVVWVVKWGVNGLAPVRPVFVLTSPVSIGAGRAVKVASAPAAGGSA